MFSHTSKVRHSTYELYTLAVSLNAFLGFFLASANSGANIHVSCNADKGRGFKSCLHNRPIRCKSMSVGQIRVIRKSASISKDCSKTCVPIKIYPDVKSLE